MRTLTSEMVTDKFVGYICDNKAEARHIRRVASWLGLVVLGLDKIADDWGFLRTRQFWFSKGHTSYKVRYAHKLRGGRRGGLQVVEMRGHADGPVVLELRSLADAEAFYNQPLAL